MLVFEKKRNYHSRMITLSPFDHLLGTLQTALASLSGVFPDRTRPNPGQDMPPDPAWAHHQKKEIAGCMRVNLSGEVAAQALYQGQSLGTADETLRLKLEQAAREEADHLVWCRERLQELHAHTSYTDPAWYAIHFFMGFLIARLGGDGINLGFLVETEHQVIRHLASHLERLPRDDLRSRAIIQQMHADESQHALMANEAGAKPLPDWAKKAMQWGSKCLTRISYYI